ncbi:hypothetical protein CR513_25274, partial [Mucuna pruriens]
MTWFLVVQSNFTYNAIISQLTLNTLGAIVSIPHLKMNSYNNLHIITIKDSLKILATRTTNKLIMLPRES